MMRGLFEVYTRLLKVRGFIDVYTRLLKVHGFIEDLPAAFWWLESVFK